MDKSIEWSPAYDKRDPDPSKNYGVHGIDLKFILKGPKGAAQFLVYTNWHLPSVREEWDAMVKAHLLQPLPADVGYHAYVPQYEGQESLTESCRYLEDGPCFYDGSGLSAQRVFDRFVTEGEDAVWEELQLVYDDIQGNGG